MTRTAPAARQPRDYVLLGLVAATLLGLGALVSSVTQALSARSSADDRQALAGQLEDSDDRIEEMDRQLQCRYVLSADVNRLQSDIFVTTAQALAAARRRDAAAVDLYTARLDQLAVQLDVANDLRDNAIEVCDTEPENVLG